MWNMKFKSCLNYFLIWICIYCSNLIKAYFLPIFLPTTVRLSRWKRCILVPMIFLNQELRQENCCELKANLNCIEILSQKIKTKNKTPNCTVHILKHTQICTNLKNNVETVRKLFFFFKQIIVKYDSRFHMHKSWTANFFPIKSPNIALIYYCS